MRTGEGVNIMIKIIVGGACESLPLAVSERLFFKGGSQIVAEAKALCASCAVREECAEFGMSAEFGIFGGLTPAERDAIRPDRVIVP